jgi:phosphatidate cytidylyltransferase
MVRLLTSAIAVPLAVLAVFYLPGAWFFGLCALLITWGAVELVRLLRPSLPGAPLWLLPPLVPLASALLALALHSAAAPATLGRVLIAVAAVIGVGLGSAVLLARTPLPQVMPALGVVAFGIPYFAAPIVSLYWLQVWDPWLVFLLCAVVWLGDAAALYVGSAIGRHKMAPVVSPKKSWEGAAAGLFTGMITTVVWSWCQLERVDLPLLLVATGAGVAAQLGDLVESLFKRSVSVKDSGGVLPGHGGMFDRMDAMLFAAPVMLVGLWLIGFEIPGR